MEIRKYHQRTFGLTYRHTWVGARDASASKKDHAQNSLKRNISINKLVYQLSERWGGQARWENPQFLPKR